MGVDERSENGVGLAQVGARLAQRVRLGHDIIRHRRPP
jgi:hypothetical protein